MLVSQNDLINAEYPGPGWHRDVLEQLDDRLAKSKEFPCTFSQAAFGRELVRFVFIESLEPEALTESARKLEEYIQLSKSWDGRLNSAHPLIVAFSSEAVQADTPEGYHKLAWQVLQHWHQVDPEPWPDDVGTDPHKPYWSMCFAGMQLFVNVSNPAHKSRKSRNLGERMLFVVNPRERFDIVAGNTPEGRRVRQRIRGRIERYDGVAHCPQLGSFKAGEIEWWQYGIVEENIERTDRCPFSFREKREAALVEL